MDDKLKILVADDSLSYRMTIQELLEENNYDVTVAQDGREALDQIIENNPDLVILDVIMPAMDGIEVCNHIRNNQRTSSIPIIMLTAKDESEDKVLGLDSGADEYLTKPFHEEELLAKLQTLLRLRSMQGRQPFSSKSVVLVADDSLTVRMELQELLDADGYKPIVVEDGQQALDAVNRNLPDLVILDVIMPKMDGIDVCKKIKSNPATRQIPVIIITSKTDIDDKIRGLNAGADDYLFKPYNTKEFKAKINALFRMKKVQMEAERNILARTNMELQEVNEKLKHTQAQLVQNEKMVALGHLVAGIAHEINNPLSFVINNMRIFDEIFQDYQQLFDMYNEAKPYLSDQTQLQQINKLEQELDLAFLQAEVPKLAQDVHEGLERIRNIVLDLRNFSRLDEAEQKRVNIIAGLESTLNLLQHQWKDHVQIVKEYGDIPDTTCFPSQLNQVFMNVLVNAIQAIPDQGKIILRTSQEDGMICIQVMDDGKGIDNDTLMHIFEPFFTTKKVGDGTGLGLSISYGIIEKHNGTIAYTSELGKGTTCTIKIPIN
ncbi:MAG: response regulator [SAR324 cluster bacterium]|nr:response regulator [SAR324 cluster bacterium]